MLIISVKFNPIALRKAKIAYNFGLSECNRVNDRPSLIISPENICLYIDKNTVHFLVNLIEAIDYE